MHPEELRKVYVKQAIKAYQRKDGYDWITAVWCAKVVGGYDRGATLGLADDMGVSTDTVEDRAHAYTLFVTLCGLDQGKFRQFVFMARRAPYIYLSHFRALYDLKNTYNLTDNQVLELLMDIVQHEGGLSTRKLDAHTRQKYGDTRGWDYYAARAMKEVHKALQAPDLLGEDREYLNGVYEWLGDKA